MSLRDHYQPIDRRADEEQTIWPSNIPALTGPEATRAVRRLWRFALGETMTREIILSSGNRQSYGRDGKFFVNPAKGWRELAHDLSHYFVFRANPGERPHSKFHARFEAKLIREVIRRGWLDGKLRDKVPAAVVQAVPSPADRYRDVLVKIETSTLRWERKAKRAQRALAKLNRRRGYYERAIAKGTA